MTEWLKLNTENISNFNFFFQIITNIFVILSVVFIGFQVRLYRKDYNERIRSSTIEKAAELSKFYAEKIVLPFSGLFTYYDAIGAFEIINKISLDDMNEFSLDELNSILTVEDMTLFDEKFNTVDPNMIIKMKFLIRSIDYTTYLDLTTQCKDCDPKDSLFFIHNLKAEFEIIALELLNHLEYFSMNFNDDIADEKTVYQSLHQTFLQISKLAYIRISRQNKNKSDKYYTHIIELFNRWKEIYQQDEAKEYFENSELEERLSALKSEYKKKNNEENRKERNKRKRAK